jgi:hypothetical protein
MHLEDYFEFKGTSQPDPKTSTAIRIKGHRHKRSL